MNKTGLTALLLIGLASQACLADLPRTPVQSPPRIFGHEIKGFDLTTSITIDRSKSGGYFGDFLMIIMSPGTFVPVSEDSEGVFYQATHGIHTITFYHLAHGGIYVSKVFRNRVWAFKGDARIGAKSGVDKDKMPLSFDELRAFRAQSSRR